MKTSFWFRFLVFFSLVACGMLSWCAFTEINENHQIKFYEIVGVGPEISGYPIEEGTLAVHQSYEDHADHLFFASGTWEQYLPDLDATPWNIVAFEGELDGLDAGAGNHYYQVKSIKSLKIHEYVSETKIRELLDRYNYCEVDDDCMVMYGTCPFGCHQFINKQYEKTVENLFDVYTRHTKEHCDYKCMALPEKVFCNNYRCEA